METSAVMLLSRPLLLILLALGAGMCTGETSAIAAPRGATVENVTRPHLPATAAHRRSSVTPR